MIWSQNRLFSHIYSAILCDLVSKNLFSTYKQWLSCVVYVCPLRSSNSGTLHFPIGTSVAGRVLTCVLTCTQRASCAVPVPWTARDCEGPRTCDASCQLFFLHPARTRCFKGRLRRRQRLAMGGSFLIHERSTIISAALLPCNANASRA